MNMPSTSANAYKQQQILTATPEQLILMLYNGCIKFINDASVAMANNDVQKAHNACVRAQDIILELVASLDPAYPISQELEALYEYANHELVTANLKKETEHLDNAKMIINNIREGWVEAMKIARAQGLAPANQKKVSGDSSISI